MMREFSPRSFDFSKGITTQTTQKIAKGCEEPGIKFEGVAENYPWNTKTGFNQG